MMMDPRDLSIEEEEFIEDCVLMELNRQYPGWETYLHCEDINDVRLSVYKAFGCPYDPYPEEPEEGVDYPCGFEAEPVEDKEKARGYALADLYWDMRREGFAC